MQVNICIHLNDPLSMPLDYHHILQSVFYNLLSDTSGYSSLHNSGETYEKRVFKLFTFGTLEGEKKTNHAKKTQTFFNKVSFEFRSFDDSLGSVISGNIEKHGITFGNRTYTDIQYRITNEVISKNDLLINMKSPIVVYKTNEETHHTHYFTPEAPVFYEAVNMNFRRKYQAAFGTPPSDDITLLPINVTKEDKYVTRYKNFIIEGYTGVYQLRGNADSLNFLYQTGLGSKNSQGFGMFEPYSL